MKRKKYSKELKTKVALAAIKGNQTANEIASEFGIHVSLVNRWKKEAIQALPLVFGETQAKQNKEIEIERERLYQKVGKLFQFVTSKHHYRCKAIQQTKYR